MGSKSVTTTTFECDFKCGATKDITDRSELNHAHVPKEWEKVTRTPSGYMTTEEHKGIPYVLCPKCFRLFEIAAMGTATPMGARFREFVNAFWANEQALNTLAETAGKHVQFAEVDVDGSKPSEGDFYGR